MKVLVTGAAGQLGLDVVDAFDDVDVVAFGHGDLDVTDEVAVHAAIRGLSPDVVVNAAGMTDVDGCEIDPQAAHRVHALGPWWLAAACRDVGARLVTISSDHVVGVPRADGRGRERGFAEFDPPTALNAYARTKAAGEALVRATLAEHHVVRTSWCVGARGRNFATAILARAAAGRPFDVVDDEVGSPTYTRDLAHAIRRLVSSRRFGVIHLANTGSCSRHEFAREILAQAGLDTEVRPVPASTLVRAATRPGFSVLDTTHAAALGIGPLPPWRDAVTRLLVELGAGSSRSSDTPDASSRPDAGAPDASSTP